MVRAIASCKCGWDSNLGVDVICGLSLLLVLFLALRCFHSDNPVFFSPKKKHFEISVPSGHVYTANTVTGAT